MFNWLRRKKKKPSASFALPASVDSSARTNVSHPTIPGRTEVKQGERARVVQKSKYLTGSLGLFSGMIRRLPRNFTPITPLPMTSDTKWNKLARDEWKAWATNPQRCDFQRRQSYQRILKTIGINLLRSGEVFQTSNATDLGPQIRLIDDTLIGGKPDNAGTEETWEDGVCYSAEGQIVAYCVKTPAGRIRVEAEKVNHILDVDRIDQPRGLPWLLSGLNGAIDIEDLLVLEKAAAKLHAALAVLVTKKTGQAEDGLTSALKRQLNNAEGGSTANSEISPLLETIEGVLVKYLQPEEDIKLMDSKRPSTAFAGFIDFLVRDLSWSLGVPPEFVWNVAGLNGNNMRFIMRDAQGFFDDVIQLLVDSSVRNTYLAVIGSAIEQGRLAPNDEWMNVEFVGPPSLTIDEGRDAEADLTRLQNGMLTYAEYWTRRNKDPREQRTAQIQWLKETIEECAEAGVPLNLFLVAAGGAAAPTDSSDEPVGGSEEQEQSQAFA